MAHHPIDFASAGILALLRWFRFVKVTDSGQDQLGPGLRGLRMAQPLYSAFPTIQGFRRWKLRDQKER
jgi:hypothetical protein